MEHEIAVLVWNEFIAQTINKGCNFSFNDLEKRIKETMDQEILTKAKEILASADTGTNECKIYNDGFIDGVEYAIKALSQDDVILSLPNKCTCWGGNTDCFSGNCTVCGNRKGNGI